MPNVHRKNLKDIFEEALSQPYHIAVIRLKIAYFLHKTDATYQSLVDDAFKDNENKLTRPAVFKFASDGKAITTDRAYWLYKKLTSYIDDNLEHEHKKEMFSLAAKASLNDQMDLEGRDADKILDELQVYAFPDYLKRTPDTVPITRYLADLGFQSSTVAFLTCSDVSPDVVDILLENDKIADQIKALQLLVRQRLVDMAHDAGINP